MHIPVLIINYRNTKLRGPDGRVVWGAGLSSCDLQVAGRFPSPPGHAALPTTGALVTVLCIWTDELHVCVGDRINGGYGRKLTQESTRPKIPIIIIIHVKPLLIRMYPKSKIGGILFGIMNMITKLKNGGMQKTAARSAAVFCIPSETSI